MPLISPLMPVPLVPTYNNEQHGSRGLSEFIHIIYTLPPWCCGTSFVSEMAPGQNVTRVELVFYTVEPCALPCTG